MDNHLPDKICLLPCSARFAFLVVLGLELVTLGFVLVALRLLLAALGFFPSMLELLLLALELLLLATFRASPCSARARVSVENPKLQRSSTFFHKQLR